MIILIIMSDNLFITIEEYQQKLAELQRINELLEQEIIRLQKANKLLTDAMAKMRTPYNKIIN